MHFNFVSPFDQTDYTPQDGDTWADFRDGEWDETGTVKTGKEMVARRFENGEWREYDHMAEYPQEIRDIIEEAKRERRK